MIIEIYGKGNCSLCESAKKKIALCLDRWGLSSKVKVIFHDMNTPYGAAEGDFHDVFEVPSVLLKRRQEPDKVLARWDGVTPQSEELQQYLDTR